MNKPENVLIVMRKQKWILQAPIVISVSMGIQKEDQNIKKTNGEQEVKKRKQKENNSSNHNCYCCITDRYRRRYRCFHGT